MKYFLKTGSIPLACFVMVVVRFDSLPEHQGIEAGTVKPAPTAREVKQGVKQAVSRPVDADNKNRCESVRSFQVSRPIISTYNSLVKQEATKVSTDSMDIPTTRWRVLYREHRLWV